MLFALSGTFLMPKAAIVICVLIHMLDSVVRESVKTDSWGYIKLIQYGTREHASEAIVDVSLTYTCACNTIIPVFVCRLQIVASLIVRLRTSIYIIFSNDIPRLNSCYDWVVHRHTILWSEYNIFDVPASVFTTK